MQIMNSQKSLFSNRKLVAPCVLCVLCLFLSGCWLDDIIDSILGENYGSPAQIGIVIYPPIPLGIKDTEDKITQAFSLSSNVEKALMAGVKDFNSHSRKTDIIPFYCKSGEVIVDFYDKIFTALEGGGQEANVRVKKVCKNQLKQIREAMPKENVSCIIFGVFSYTSSSQTAINVQLCYYDRANDIWCTQQQVVSLNNNRAQSSDLERLMKNLLQKVYE